MYSHTWGFFFSNEENKIGHTITAMDRKGGVKIWIMVNLLKKATGYIRLTLDVTAGLSIRGKRDSSDSG